ncbi:MAG: hypothetical protein EXR77_12450 [Myxococcales bacterium]|nr:hypothetical protein [Myxococcales bacterium]
MGGNGTAVLGFLFESRGGLDGLSARRLVEVRVLDPNLAPEIFGLKNTFVDFRAKDAQGRTFIFEMQVLDFDAFENRVLYDACKAVTNQLASAQA